MKERLRETVEEEMKLDMTPMIDVVFLLIIFFLCIDFKVLEAKLPAYLPKDVGAHSTEVEPQEKLSIRVVCDSFGNKLPRPGSKTAYRLEGHTIHWEVGPEKVREVAKLVSKLEEIFRDPSKRQTDPKTGERKPMSVVIEPLPLTTYGDVATTVDAVTKAGFTEINFGGGYGSAKNAKK
jgi:biopolymer transport protein ExbD